MDLECEQSRVSQQFLTDDDEAWDNNSLTYFNVPHDDRAIIACTP